MKKTRYCLFLLGVLSILIVITSCRNNKDGAANENPNSPTSGTLTVFCDEGISQQLKGLAFTFNSIYKRANVVIKVCNEKLAIESLYNDSCSVIALSRNLTEQENKLFNKGTVYPQFVFLAKTAVALVINKNSQDSVATIGQIKQILSGDSMVFKNARNVVFADQNSGISRFLKDSLLLGKPFGKNCHAVDNTPQLIELIEKNATMLGIVDYSWLSDKDDSLTKAFLKRVKIIPLARSQESRAFYPDQSNLQTEDYCLTRRIHVLRRGEDFSLAAGFLSFIASDKGQIMMLKSGLAPAKQPERVVEVKLEPIGTN